MEIPEARWVIWITLLIIAVCIAVYVSKLFRDLAIGGLGPSDGELLDDVEAIRSTGFVSENEYERMRTNVREKQLGNSPEQDADKPNQPGPPRKQGNLDD